MVLTYKSVYPGILVGVVFGNVLGDVFHITKPIKVVRKPQMYHHICTIFEVMIMIIPNHSSVSISPKFVLF